MARRFGSHGNTRFSVRTNRRNGVIRLYLAGELDLMSAPALQERLGRVERDGCASVVLDLQHLNFFDRSGLRVVLDTAQRLRERGGRLAVVNASGIVRTVFDLTGNADLLDQQQGARTDASVDG